MDLHSRRRTSAAALTVAATLVIAGCTTTRNPTPTGAASGTTASATGSSGAGSTSAPSAAEPTGATGPSESTSAAESSSTDGSDPTSSAASTQVGPTGPVLPTGTPADVVTGLEAPWSIVFVGGTPLVSERDSGRILEVIDGSTREVGVVDGVVHEGEGGLLGLAVLDDPAGSTYLYAYFTAAQDNRIVRFPLTGGPGTEGLGPVEPIFAGIAKAGNHDGGRIAFGPDGMLYVTAGDAGNRSAAQDPASLNGKILRLTPTGAVPADNPIAGNPMWSMGHRNPQGIGWAADGTMFAAEFGQDTWDELNIITPGANYGWPTVEGITDSADAGFVNPVQQWATDDASPSGLAVIGGTIFVANLKGQRVRAIPVADPGSATELWTGEYGRLRHVAAAPDGSLWILTNNTDGRGDPDDGDDRILTVPLAPA